LAHGHGHGHKDSHGHGHIDGHHGITHTGPVHATFVEGGDGVSYKGPVYIPARFTHHHHAPAHKHVTKAKH